MVYQRQIDLLERKRRLGWTNREIGNALGVAPGVASSKLHGFILLKDQERKRLESAMVEAEKAKALPADIEETAHFLNRNDPKRWPISLKDSTDGLC